MRRNDPNSTTQCAAVCRFATLTSSALLGCIIRSYMLYLVAQATAQRSALMAGSSPAMNCVPQPGSARRQHSLPAVLSGRRVLLRNVRVQVAHTHLGRGRWNAITCKIRESWFPTHWPAITRLVPLLSGDTQISKESAGSTHRIAYLDGSWEDVNFDALRHITIKATIFTEGTMRRTFSSSNQVTRSLRDEEEK
ncbi:hypothetical protein F5141DRAFT_451741 [Pisolithus sp. B1]|nr:hypothetical protein F5141DRAFT_451741 [Pisolithus sp. B1]